MWRLMWSPAGSRQALALLEHLPQVTELRSCSAATAALQHLLAHPQMGSVHAGLNNSQPIQALACSGCRFYSSSELSSAASSSDSPSQAQNQQQQQQQDQSTLHTSTAEHKQPAAAAGRHRQLAQVEQNGFVTLPPQATASGYQESFLQASQTSSSSSSSSSSSMEAAAGQPVKVPVTDMQLPQEQLRIQLRQEVQQQDVQEEVDVYSLSRSLMGHENRSFEATAAAADDAAPQQQQQLSASDRQLLEKLVGIMTKDGKKSRARRLLLDAMHIIKQQVAKGQQVA